MAGVKHVDIDVVESYVKTKIFPASFKGDKGRKANLRRASKRFSFVGAKFMYNGNRLVIKSQDERIKIIKDIHEGLGDDDKARAMASHRGRDTTYQKIMKRFFWFNIIDDVANFVKQCDTCQRQGKLQNSKAPELQSVPVPTAVMKQIGIDICNLPEVDGYKHLVVCIDYFSKWSEAKPVTNKSASTVASFLYEIICTHGCMKMFYPPEGLCASIVPKVVQLFFT